ncbi:family transcriptional regulator : Sulfurtransferase OS=Mesorhizobium plurifarium GN=MPL3365_70597 PE=4 SV=1: HTH_20 [Gemmata massiliana]|uniref:HTH arsR-type domain-containing protein n=1 Tax=Gemmata massiliana TaxID=1210884 RepID=A0A6P2CUQ0_9BACT|nr:metalloregulator ArsR/SmtB family transcription factor [Gemmata massiliana]VTR90832.1 family transcriptional regulator : Sulfurtransferase OS=Mesorhizobium plurifarium GN=MPL3365_70597 PE=4 SV=1: HTH_20 [Gemmata massiliana]
MPKPSAELRSQANWLVALGEPTRLAIMRKLAAGTQTVTVLARELGTEIVNISHHLSVLKDVELVSVERDGRFMNYSLVNAAVSGNRLELTHPSGIQIRVPLE